MYTLNEVGSIVWELIDGKKQVKEISEHIIKSFKVSKEEAEEDLIDFIKQLEEIGLVNLSPKTYVRRDVCRVLREYEIEMKTYDKPSIYQTKLIDEGKAFYGALADTCCVGTQRCPSKCTFFI
jgi:hypothetical protein